MQILVAVAISSPTASQIMIAIYGGGVGQGGLGTASRGPAMQWNQFQAKDVSARHRRESETAAVIPLPRPIVLDGDTIERSAQALFEFVFSSCGRLEWATCDEETKRGFRGEARAVIVGPCFFADLVERFAQGGARMASSQLCRGSPLKMTDPQATSRAGERNACGIETRTFPPNMSSNTRTRPLSSSRSSWPTSSANTPAVTFTACPTSKL